MWTSKNRARYDRSKLRYPSDVTDEEWELIVPLIPPGKSGGGQTDGDHARGSERPYLRSVDRLSVARNPERPAAEKHGLRSIPVAIAYTLFFDRFISGITGGAVK